jgi:hypothetical protein
MIPDLLIGSLDRGPRDAVGGLLAARISGMSLERGIEGRTKYAPGVLRQMASNRRRKI